MYTPMPYVLERAIYEIYEDYYDDHNMTYILRDRKDYKEVEGSDKCIVSLIDKSNGQLVIDTIDAFGEEEKLNLLGYENKSSYMYPEVWKNHFVGRNNLANVDKLISEEKTFFAKSEIIVEILKLYGIKYELATYNVGDYISGSDVQKITLYFK